MRTATRTITYYDCDDGERGKRKTVVKGDSWFKLLTDHDGLGQCERR